MYLFFIKETVIGVQVGLCITFHFKGVKFLSRIWTTHLQLLLALSQRSFDKIPACSHLYSSSLYAITH